MDSFFRDPPIIQLGHPRRTHGTKNINGLCFLRRAPKATSLPGQIGGFDKWGRSIGLLVIVLGAGHFFESNFVFFCIFLWSWTSSVLLCTLNTRTFIHWFQNYPHGTVFVLFVIPLLSNLLVIAFGSIESFFNFRPFLTCFILVCRASSHFAVSGGNKRFRGFFGGGSSIFT